MSYCSVECQAADWTRHKEAECDKEMNKSQELKVKGNRKRIEVMNMTI